MSERKPAYTEEEMKKKRQKMFPKVANLRRCENCGQNAVLSDGTCFQCGHSPKIG